MQKIYFITKNKHKYTEIKEIMKKFNIEVEQIPDDKEEPSDMAVHETAAYAAKKLCEKYKKPVVVEDTGFFFEAYNNFPGSRPRYVYETIGYEGMFRLLRGKSRKAYAMTVAAYCEPKKVPRLFEGRMYGKITPKVHNPNKDRMPYERIFIPDGFKKTVSDLTLDQKNEISNRGKAFEKLARWLNDRNHS